MRPDLTSSLRKMTANKKSDRGKIFKRRLPRKSRVYRLPYHMRPEETEPQKTVTTVQPTSEEARLRRTNRWKRLRAVVVNTCPMCMLCQKSKTMLVHHIVPASENMELFFEMSNMAPLCLSCHQKVHKAYDRGIPPEVIFPADKRLDAFY